MISSYSTSIKNPIRTIVVGGNTTSSGGGGGTNYWTQNGNNIYNNNSGTVGINTSNPDNFYNLDVSGSVRIRGDLLVDGSSTIIDTNILKVEDPLIHLGINNPADLKAGGFYVEYRDASNNKNYTGMVRPPGGTGYVLLNNSFIEPSDAYPDISTSPSSSFSVERLGVNRPLSSLSSFYADISGLSRIWTNRVLIGSNAGTIGQDSNAIAIGNNAGNFNQGLNSVAIGLNTAYYLQQPNAVAVGRSAGAIAQGQNTVAMGYMAGEASQNTGALSLGFQAGRTFQGTNSIAIGVNAGEVNQGCNAIAIGNLAGQNNQCNNTIVLNASGSNLSTAGINGLYIDPIRDVITNKTLYYNTGTKEITYSDVSSGLISSINITDISAVGTTTYYPTFVDGSGNKPLYIDSTNTLSYKNQNFGIGTNNPNFRLDVSGTAVIRGNLTVNSTLDMCGNNITNLNQISALSNDYKIDTLDRMYQQLNADPSWNNVNGFVALSKDAYPGLNPYSSGVKAVSTWNTRSSAADNAWLSVCWSPELRLFVAVSATGSGNRVMTSPDGITWTSRTSASDNNWTSVCWSPELGLFVAVSATGSGNRVMTSSDGITWTSRTSASDNNWYSVCWSSELRIFVAVAVSGLGDRVMTSSDGITWTSRTSAANNNWLSVCWSPELGLFVAVANSGIGNRVMTSPDGISWTTRSSAVDNGWFSVCWSPELGLFVAVSNTGTGNRVMTSSDGITWTARTSATNNEWISVCWSAELELFVAVSMTGSGNRVMTSPDGISWTSRSSAANNSWYSVCWAPELGIFVAISQDGGGNRVMTSSLLGRPPTSYNVFDSSFNNIDSAGNWTLKTKSIYSDGNIVIDPANNLTVEGTLDVSGTANISGNLSVDTNILFVDASNNRVGVGTTTPETRLDVVGNSIQCSNQGRFKGWNSGGQGTGLATEIGTLSGEGYINTVNRPSNAYGNLNLVAGNANIKLQTNGNVGIGTYTPSTTLDVSGTANITGNLSVDTNTLFVDASNNRVGVGTITPTEKLNINGGNILMNGSFNGMVMNPGAGGESLVITRNGEFTNNVTGFADASGYRDNIGAGIGGGAQISLLKNQMSFSTFPTGTAGNPITLTERMRLTATGLGINTTTPGYKLHVEGSGTANEVVGWFNNQGSVSSSIAVRQGSKTVYITNHNGTIGPVPYAGQVSNAIALGSSSASAPIQFYNGAPVSAKMTILDNGNTGIGTNAPAYPLDVNGSAKMTTIRDTANSVGTSGQVLSSTGSALSWISPSFQMAIIQETRPANTNSAVTWTASASPTPPIIRPRQFNFKTEAGLSITLGGTPNWTFTIPTAGTYLFEANAYFTVPTADNQTVFSKLFLNNTTLGLGSAIVGDSNRWGPTIGSTGLVNTNVPCFMNGIYTITGITVFSLDHHIRSQFFAPIGGAAVDNTGAIEVYATIKITKLS